MSKPIGQAVNAAAANHPSGGFVYIVVKRFYYRKTPTNKE
jgi:hypothetical protein